MRSGQSKSSPREELQRHGMLKLPALTLALTNTERQIESWAGIFASDGLTDLVIIAFAASIILPTKARLQLKLVWYMPFLIRLWSVFSTSCRLCPVSFLALCTATSVSIAD